MRAAQVHDGLDQCAAGRLVKADPFLHERARGGGVERRRAAVARGDARADARGDDLSLFLGTRGATVQPFLPLVNVHMDIIFFSIKKIFSLMCCN